jgi:hypothetical protein
MCPRHKGAAVKKTVGTAKGMTDWRLLKWLVMSEEK